jgi:hypothetical protein
MIEIVKKILFKGVLIIMLLHTFISHSHSDEMSEVAHFKLHQDNNSLIAILKIAFHESDDENLDNLFFTHYKTDKLEKHNAPLYLAISTDNISFDKHSITTFFKCDNYPSTKNFIVKINGLRGPPKFL